MSVAHHHAEWLSLVEASGPFISMPVLMRAFPQGLDLRDSQKASALRAAYEDWLERGEHHADVHRAWVRHVLTLLLEYPDMLLLEGQSIAPGLEAAMPQFGEMLRPTLALKRRDTDSRPPLLITVYPPIQSLEAPVSGTIWKAGPGTRMMELLHALDCSLGLVTNGEQWMLVNAPRGETTGFASWYADLWFQEPITLRAFTSLLHVRRFFGVGPDETLPALLQSCSKDQQEVTDQLGYQVRQAVEVLVQALDRIDTESRRTLLVGVEETQLYDSALTVMMRLVFLFAAEERGLLLLGDPLYDQYYAVSTLRDILRERADQHGEEVLERRHDAWCRLLATFRAVHSGIEHEAMHLPAYGGTLFDPDRYPFLEGRLMGTTWTTDPAKPLPVNNRVVLHLLEALQVLRVKVPGGGHAEARRISFRSLDIEQIGHVYEGLLDHTACRAADPVLGLAGTREKEPEIPLSDLEKLQAAGVDSLIEFLNEETGRSKNALRKAIESPEFADNHKFLIACGQDTRLVQRVRPFSNLLRLDSFGQFVVIPEGSVYVTKGSARRSSGTHYTPRSLTEPIVQHALEPLVYIGPAEGKPQAEWQLKSPKDILELKVCDLAMGSGAFLVQACRYLSERLVEAWERAEREHPNQYLVTPEGEFSMGDPEERLLPGDAAERLSLARRYVADRCLYGVDINSMAVEMAKLSLWLVTLQKNRPFTFLDHALKCGDSVLGVSDLKQIENFSLRSRSIQHTFGTINIFRYVEEAAEKRRQLEALPSETHRQLVEKQRLHAESEAATGKIKALADCLIAFELRGFDGDKYDQQRAIAADHVEGVIRKPLPEFQAYARAQLSGALTFHWPVEFPEILHNRGFDAFIGNPPFLGGKRISSEYGAAYESFLKKYFDAKGAADLCCYFYRRAFDLLDVQRGTLGMLATKSINEGDSPGVGLQPIVEHGGTIFRATRSFVWPGAAGVFVAQIHITKGEYAGTIALDNCPASRISSFLADESEDRPYKLKRKICSCSAGRQLYGQGFIIEPGLAEQFRTVDPRNSEVIKPYFNSDIFNTSFDMTPVLWAIDFGEMEEEAARQFAAVFDHLVQYVKPIRDKLTKQIHEERFWLYWDKRPGFFTEAAKKPKILVYCRTNK